MLKKIEDTFLYLYVFTLGFENWDPFGLVGIISISKIISILYFLSILPRMSNFFIPKFPKKIIYTLMCLTILYYSVSIAYSDLLFGNTVSTTFLNNVIMFLIVTNHIIIGGRAVLKKIFVSLAFIPIIQALLILNNIGYSLSSDNRLILFGENPNNLGIIASASLLISIILIADNFLSLSKRRFLLLFSVFTSISVILATASRGAIIASALSILLFLFLIKMPFFQKAIFILFLLPLLYYFYISNESSELIASRIQELVEDGDQSRFSILKDIEHFAFDNPIFGFGETGYYSKMVQYRGSYKSSHNGFLNVYLYTGILGCILFFRFLYYIMKYCWLLYKRQSITIPSILFCIAIFNFAKSGSGWNFKFLWLVFSIIIGMYYLFEGERNKQRKI